MCCLLSVY